MQISTHGNWRDCVLHQFSKSNQLSFCQSNQLPHLHYGQGEGLCYALIQPIKLITTLVQEPLTKGQGVQAAVSSPPPPLPIAASQHRSLIYTHIFYKWKDYQAITTCLCHENKMKRHHGYLYYRRLLLLIRELS